MKTRLSVPVYFERRVKDPDFVLLLVHGMGAHSGRWDFAADYFLKHNISSYSIELQGYGQTEGTKGHIDSFKEYYKDLLALCQIIKNENPGKKVCILAESMGALISFIFASRHQGLFSGLICISPAFGNGMTISLSDYLRMIMSLFYNKKKRFVMPFTSKMCTRDEAYQKAMDNDPREHRFATSGTLWEIVKAQLMAPFAARRLKLPVLFLAAGDIRDKLVSVAAEKKIFGLLKKNDPANKFIQYPEMLHALSIDEGREKVFGDILGWARVL
ncbi:MAG: alpha/beta fold hydrolase [Candidatus Margulisiibacteriota bacterium]